MNMDKKYQLHTGLKAIIQTSGTEPLRTVQLANILADYSAYDEYPATKIIKTILIYESGLLILFTLYIRGAPFLALFLCKKLF